MNLLINISSDFIQFFYNNQSKSIIGKDIQSNFPDTFVDLINKNQFNNLYVINGPGSFTNLRSACVSMNTANLFLLDKIGKFTISKIDFYRHFYLSGLLPRFGYIFIGQRKNFWLYDFYTNNYTIQSKDSILGNGNEYFIDVISKEFYSNTDNVILIDNKSDSYAINFKGNEFVFHVSDLNWNRVDSFVPNYIINPNIY